MWTSSISTTQASTLAGYGAADETNISTSQQETESVFTTIENVAALLIIPYRSSVNLPPVVTPVKDVHTCTGFTCYFSLVFCATLYTPTKEEEQPVYKKETYPLEYGLVVAPDCMSSNVLSPSKEK